MPKVTDSLETARLLADFSNLEASAPPGHPTHPDYFRNNHPDFAPKGWWDSQYTDWESTQKLLRHAWRNQFQDGIYYMLNILGSVTAPLRVANALANAHRAGLEKVKEMFGEQAAEEMANRRGRAVSPPAFSESDYIPMQRAIVYLFEHSWRARFCAECNKRFVAAEPKNKFCSESCSNKAHNRQRLKSWHAHKHEWRPTRGNRRATRATKRRGIKVLRKPHV